MYLVFAVLTAVMAILSFVFWIAVVGAVIENDVGLIITSLLFATILSWFTFLSYKVYKERLNQKFNSKSKPTIKIEKTETSAANNEADELNSLIVKLTIVHSDLTNIQESCFDFENESSKLIRYEPEVSNVSDELSFLIKKLRKKQEAGGLVQIDVYPADQYQFTYCDASNNVTHRTVKFKNIDDGYLSAIDLDKHAHRTFRVDRISDLVNIDTGEVIDDAEIYFEMIFDTIN